MKLLNKLKLTCHRFFDIIVSSAKTINLKGKTMIKLFKGKNLSGWFKRLFTCRNDFKNDYVCYIDHTGVTWVVNDLSDIRKKQLYRVLWRTNDTGFYANETNVWAAEEDDIKGILIKRFKLKKNIHFIDFKVYLIYPHNNKQPTSAKMSQQEYDEIIKMMKELKC